MMTQRPSWQEYFMQMALLAATRSTCLRRAVGAALVRDNQIISTGYNGSPKNSPHCNEVGCLREAKNIPSGEKHELCRGVHAEQNAIIQAAINGSSTRDAELYCTHQPCSICAKMIINAEIRRIYIANSYPDDLALQLLTEASIEMILLNPDNGVCQRIC